ALYQSLVETMPQAIYRKDTSLRYTFVNSRYCTALGIPREQVIGRTTLDIFHTPEADRHHADDQRILAGGTASDTITEYVGPDGARKFLRVIKAPLHERTDASGNG